MTVPGMLNEWTFPNGNNTNWLPQRGIGDQGKLKTTKVVISWTNVYAMHWGLLLGLVKHEKPSSSQRAVFQLIHQVTQETAQSFSAILAFFAQSS